MGFGEQLRQRRKELGLSREELADKLGVTRSAVGNYETGLSAPKESVLLRLFDVLQVEPNYLYRDFYAAGRAGQAVSEEEQSLLKKYRDLSLMQAEAEQDRPAAEARTIPLYCSPAAAGYAAPVFGEDYELLPVAADVPPGAELAVRIQGDSMEPYIHDESVVYVNHDPLLPGDVGIFCVDGDMLCKQYYRDPMGTVYLFSLNRSRSDADQVFTAGSGRSLTCFGRVMLHTPPLPI